MFIQTGLKELADVDRARLKARLLFRQNEEALEFFFVDNHDDVRRVIQDF